MLYRKETNIKKADVMRILIVLLLLTAGHLQSSGQVLISLLLGDKLNSGAVEFGLDGGLSVSSLSGLDNSERLEGFHLGFYFDIRLRKTPSPWLFHTGVIVKSRMGAEDLPVYSLNDPNLDNAFAGGNVRRKLGYFNVPFMMKYKFKNNFFAEAGPMFGLMSKSTKDEFIGKDENLEYTIKTKDRYHPLDAGFIVGVGYRLMGGNGMNLGIRYYWGFVDVTVDDSTPNQYNRSLYLAVGIPIGAGKAKAKAEATKQN
jgi:hypothetical protein